MASTRGQRLRAARERRGFKSGRVAAQALGVAISTYGAHERAEAAGGRDYGPEEAKFYGRHFGVSPEWLLTGRAQGEQDEVLGTSSVRGTADEMPKVPVVGYVGVGGEVHEYAVAPDVLDQVDQPRGSPDTTVAVEIRCDILGPAFNRWLIFFDRTRRPPTPGVIGELCAVGLANGRTMIQQLQRGRRDALYNLSSLGSQVIVDAKVEWAARIDWMALRPR